MEVNQVHPDPVPENNENVADDEMDFDDDDDNQEPGPSSSGVAGKAVPSTPAVRSTPSEPQASCLQSAPFRFMSNTYIFFETNGISSEENQNSHVTAPVTDFSGHDDDDFEESDSSNSSNDLHDDDDGNEDAVLNAPSPACSSQGSILSPLSSHGSESSGEFVVRQTEKILANCEQNAKICAELSLPKAEQKLWERFCQDQSFRLRLQKLILKDFESFSISEGMESNADCINLREKMSSDPTLLFGWLSKTLLDVYRRSLEKSNAGASTENSLGREVDPNLSMNGNNNEDMDTSAARENVAVTPVTSGQSANVESSMGDGTLLEPQTLATPASSSSSVEVDGSEQVEELVSVQGFVPTTATPGPSSGIIPPAVPNFIPAVEESVRNLSLKRKESPFCLTDKALKEAYDFMSQQDVRLDDLRRAGRVLFSHAFSTDEILECTLGGKSKMRQFDPDKKRAILEALAYLKMKELKPMDRTVEKLRDRLNNVTLKLEKQEEDYIITKVFVEFAAQQRKKLKEGQQNRNNNS